MENDNSKDEEPSTSKKENRRTDVRSDIDDKNGDDQDTNMDSLTSRTSSESIDRRVENDNARFKVTKSPLEKKESRRSERKKKKTTGRIEKRNTTRRNHATRRPLKRKQRRYNNRKKHDPSISTIFSRLSSGSVSPSVVGCMYCGHRCCRRRYEEERKKAYQKRRADRSRKRQKLPKRRPPTTTTQGSECVQVGSKCLMLSSLCINTNAALAEQPTEDPTMSCEVTPEMIYETVRKLTMWEQEVSTIAILEYIRRNYPVCQDIPALFEELDEKLYIAALAGIVAHTSWNCWNLPCELQNRQLTRNHVTVFWKAYVDTMRPVSRKCYPSTATDEKDEKRTNTSTGAAMDIV